MPRMFALPEDVGAVKLESEFIHALHRRSWPCKQCHQFKARFLEGFRLLHRRNREEERRAFAGLALDPNAAAVPLDDLFADAQPDARAREFFLSVKPLKNHEDALEILRRDANAIVAHGQFPDRPLALAADVDLRRRFSVELEGVAHEVLEKLSEQARIAFHSRERVEGELGAGVSNGGK